MATISSQGRTMGFVKGGNRQRYAELPSLLQSVQNQQQQRLRQSDIRRGKPTAEVKNHFLPLAAYIQYCNIYIIMICSAVKHFLVLAQGN